MAFIPAVIGAVGSAVGGSLGIGATAGAGLGSWATAATLASGIVGTYGAVKSANAQNAAAQFNAASAQQEAAQTIEQGNQQSQQQMMKTAQIEGQSQAQYAAAGVDPNQGSAAEVKAQTAAIGEHDALTTQMNAANQAQALQTQAQGDLASQVNPGLAGATTALGTWASYLNSSYMKKVSNTTMGMPTS